MRCLRCFPLSLLVTTFLLISEAPSQGNNEVYVDRGGVLRWKGTEEEVRLFGVNYTAPFAYSYRAHNRLGLSIKKAIDLDVAHMVRLDLDAYRIHVWDREVSDREGNLLSNEHLDLLDYLLARLAESGIKSILTPIAWWGTGWPEPDDSTEGFSQHYSKLELITNQNAREAQRRYLKQFIQHINPYRKRSYLEDPSIIAIEIINEPNHPADDRETTTYIDEMAQVLRNAGLTKPIFYNISENWSDLQAAAVARANVEGVTFQWYPTDLVHGRMLTGNFLPNVEKYPVPSERIPGYNTKAKMVYEFDAADVGGAYMYPAMARAFREAGMQFAAMFSYDPVQIAWSNTEYPTHFVNLLYTPSKAISLMIAANAFRLLPRMKSYGEYPANNRFADFRVSYEENLSELNSATAFLYSGTTSSVPKDSRALMRIAGVGSSRLVRYTGTGAYFLDKVATGVWRLEVFPDVLWLRDPFQTTSMSRQVARLFWRERTIALALPDLGEAYVVRPLDRSDLTLAARSEHFVRPGRFLVSRRNLSENEAKKFLVKPEFLEGLYVPPPEAPRVYVVNRSRDYMLESSAPPLAFLVAAEDSIEYVTLYLRRPGWRGFAGHSLKDVGRFTYTLADEVQALQSGRVEYCVAVRSGGRTLTFPGGVSGSPERWDHQVGELWTMKILAPGEPIVVFDVRRDWKDIVYPHFSSSLRYLPDYRNGSTSEEVAASPSVRFSGPTTKPFAFQVSVGEKLQPFEELTGRCRTVVVSARSRDSSATIGVHLLMSDGKGFTATVNLTNEWHEYQLPLSAFHRGDALLLPDVYPRFLTRLWTANTAEPVELPDLRMLERLQVSVDPEDVRGNGARREMRFDFSSLKLVP